MGGSGSPSLWRGSVCWDSGRVQGTSCRFAIGCADPGPVRPWTRPAPVPAGLALQDIQCTAREPLINYYVPVACEVHINVQQRTRAR